jgi:uncharacterized protein YndB with AHSA1/START domain
MEGQRFDDIARTLAGGLSRRTVVRRIGAVAAGAGLALLGRGRGEAATCRGVGLTCREHANCCSRNCGPKNSTGRRTCAACGPGEEDCGIFDVKCCPIGSCFTETCLFGPASTGQHRIESAWKAILERDALAPALSFAGFEPQPGHRFQISTSKPGRTGAVADAEVVEVAYPTRMVFRWRLASMPEPATVELKFVQMEDGPRVAVNRIAGDPASCDLATALIGRRWQQALLGEKLPKFLEQMPVE